VEADLLGVNRLVEDIGDELVGIAPVVVVMVIAQREITEFHSIPQLLGLAVIPSLAPLAGRESV
jgi:hypothetical protein